MKSPLRYQMSEYDCGPTTMLNGISYLFPRESISPEIIRNIMLYSLDSYGGEGIMGKAGNLQCGHDVLKQLAERLWENR